MKPLTPLPPTWDKVERLKQNQQKGKSDNAGLKEVAQDFEAVLLETLLKTMRQSIPKGGLLDGGQSEEIYTMLFDREIAQRMAERGVGLADLIERQLEKQVPAPTDSIQSE